MGTVTHHGWRTSLDEIPQPVGIVMGRNLRPDQTAQQAAKERELFAKLKAVKQYPIEPDEPRSSEINDGET